MIVKIFLIDTFADGLFSGGRAGVAILRHLGQEVFLQALAAEMNLPVMAYVLPHNEEFIVRYFTPTHEIGLSGYAALAAGRAIFSAGLAPPDRPVHLHGRDGRREVFPDPDSGDLSLKLERLPAEKKPEIVAELTTALGLAPGDVSAVLLTGNGHLVVCGRSQAALKPLTDQAAIPLWTAHASYLTLSAPLEIADVPGYVVRGRAANGEEENFSIFDLHAVLAPFWTLKMGNPVLEIHHQAARACHLRARVTADGRVVISGQANLVLRADPVMDDLTGALPPEF